MGKKDNTEEKIKNQVESAEVETIEDTEDTKDQRTEEEKLQDELASEKDKFMRLFAEFENYKKRTTKERIELFKTASQDVMTKKKTKTKMRT